MVTQKCGCILYEWKVSVAVRNLTGAAVYWLARRTPYHKEQRNRDKINNNFPKILC